MSKPTEFDAEKAVADFRRVIERLDGETTAAGKTKLDARAKRMHLAWKKWQGEDSLYEMAFGEPQ
jgi:hypothetical protein